MTDAHNDRDSSRSTNADAESQDDVGTLVAWTAGSGDKPKSHIVHIGPDGMTWALGLKKPEAFGQIVGAVTAQPSEAAAIIQQGGGQHLSRKQISRVTYTKDLSQLVVIDEAGKRQKIAQGKGGEQEKVFEAVGRHLGGEASEEDADAWSVMQVPLYTLAIFGAIGGFMIYCASTSDPSFEASGRRQRMQQLLNWLGYTIGPTWMSVIVGVPLLLIVAFMVYLLVKRPKRQVLEF